MNQGLSQHYRKKPLKFKNIKKTGGNDQNVICKYEYAVMKPTIL